MNDIAIIYIGILSVLVIAGFCCITIAIKGIRDSLEDIYKDIATIKIDILKQSSITEAHTKKIMMYELAEIFAKKAGEMK